LAWCFLIDFLLSLISGFLLHSFSETNEAQVIVASYVAASVLNKVSVVHLTILENQFHSSSSQLCFSLFCAYLSALLFT
jgi:hypothetical protein